MPDPAGQDGFPEFPGKIGLVFVRLDKTGGLAGNFLQVMTGHRAESLVGEKNFPRLIRQNYAIGSGCQSAGLNTQLLFHPLALLSFPGLKERASHGRSQPMEMIFENIICSA